jgi:hypothetical protein
MGKNVGVDHRSLLALGWRGGFVTLVGDEARNGEPVAEGGAFRHGGAAPIAAATATDRTYQGWEGRPGQARVGKAGAGASNGGASGGTVRKAGGAEGQRRDSNGRAPAEPPGGREAEGSGTGGRAIREEAMEKQAAASGRWSTPRQCPSGLSMVVFRFGSGAAPPPGPLLIPLPTHTPSRAMQSLT